MQRCLKCGSHIKEGTNFCSSCGTENKGYGGVKLPDKTVLSRIGSMVSAAPVPGRMVFTHHQSQMPGTDALSPVRYLAETAGKFGVVLKRVSADKKLILPGLVLGVIWLVLMLLPYVGINGRTVRVLSFLTFAGGGARSGFLQVIGGVAGKGVYAYFITAMLIPLLTGKRKIYFRKVVQESVNRFRKLSLKGTGKLPFLFGAGVALIVYNFIAGSSELQYSMAGVAALFLSLRSLKQNSGFMYGFAFSIVFRFTGRLTAELDTNRILAGIVSGFAVSFPLSAFGWGEICYTAGAAAIAVAVISGAVTGRSKISAEI